LREFGTAIRGKPGDGADAHAGLLATWMAVEARRASLERCVVMPLGRDMAFGALAKQD
jgi:hypothetical protein